MRYWKVSVGLKCVRMSRIPWLWNLLSQYWLEIETSFCFFPPPWGRQLSPKIIVRDNFCTNWTNLLLQWWRYTHMFNRFSWSGISTFRHWRQGLANETWNPKRESHHSPCLARNANGNPSSETSRPLATLSLTVGRFAAKQGSLLSQRGRLVASLCSKGLLTPRKVEKKFYFYVAWASCCIWLSLWSDLVCHTGDYVHCIIVVLYYSFIARL